MSLKVSLAKTGVGLLIFAGVLLVLSEDPTDNGPTSLLRATPQAEVARGGSYKKSAIGAQALDRHYQSDGYLEAAYSEEIPSDSGSREPVQHIGKPIVRLDTHLESSPQHIGTALVRADTYHSEDILHIGVNFQRVDDFSRSADAQHIGSVFNREDDYSGGANPQHIGSVFYRENE